MTDYSDFVEYVYSFYGRHGIYDMDANRQQILTATRIHATNNPNYEGDSVDREAVRDIMMREFNLKFPD